MFPHLDILLDYWIEHLTFGLLYVMFTFPTMIFYRGVPGFATDYPRGVWWRGLTTCLLYVGPLFWKSSLIWWLVWKFYINNFFVVFDWQKPVSLKSIRNNATNRSRKAFMANMHIPSSFRADRATHFQEASLHPGITRATENITREYNHENKFCWILICVKIMSFKFSLMNIVS